MDQLERLAAYTDGGYRQVKGYSVPSILTLILPAIQKFHAKHAISGDVGEIGVHHGRFFLALDALRASGERSSVVDVFGDQDLNIDNSGRGDRAAFDANINKYSHEPSSIHVFSGDSLSPEYRRYLDENRFAFRLFSVDGGHTVHHALHDMKTAEERMVNGGFIILDDFCNPNFPEVTEAAVRYCDRKTPFVPVASISTKLFFASLSYADEFRKHLSKFVLSSEGFRVRNKSFCGHSTLTVSRSGALAEHTPSDT